MDCCCDMLKESRFIWLQRFARLVTRVEGHSRMLLLLSNLLLLAGLYLLAYVGGLYSQAQYYREAARGDSDLPVPAIVARVSGELDIRAPIPDFSAPDLSSGLAPYSAVGTTTVPATTQISRIVIASIGVDAKVIDVGWHVEAQDGVQVAVWEVAEYAVGHHRDSANPGQGSNIVLAGHVGGFGKIFKDLFYTRVGDQVILYSNDRQYLYTIHERLIINDEDALPFEQRIANAHFLEPTPSETVTLITCWPPEGPDRYKQRIILRAVPYELPNRNQSVAWTIR